MPVLFVFTITAPEGTWRTCFELEPDHFYCPSDVQVETGEGPVAAAHTLTVTATQLPTGAEFREVAAHAATQAADDSPDPFQRLLNLLIPFEELRVLDPLSELEPTQET